MARKKTQGRKKIEMKKIESDDARRIAFSKRRSGLFKKASELSTLCGLHIAIIVYSIGGKAFSFGHPNVESAINRFENANHQEDDDDYITKFTNSIRDSRLHVLNEQFNDLNDKLAEVRKKRKVYEMIFEKFGCQSFEDFVDKLDPSQLEQVKETMRKWKEYLTPNSIGFPIPRDWLKL